MKRAPRFRPTFAALLVIPTIALGVWTSGCANPASDSSASGGGTPAPGGALIVAARAEPKTFNRLLSTRSSEELLAQLTQATLVRVNRVSGAIEPRLAREWSQSPDGLTWTFKLREGVTFSDGAPFSSADVMFTFQALYDETVKSEIRESFLINGQPLMVRAPDANTVVMVAPAPSGVGVAMLDSLPILPRHKLATALTSGTFRDAWGVTAASSDVVGLGPFQLESFKPGEKLTVTRNPHFWMKDSSGRALPYLDRIEIQLVPDQSAQMLRLQSGAADLVTGALRAEDMATLEAAETSGGVKLLSAGVAVNTDALWFNLGPAAAAAKDKSRKWLQSADLRRGVSAAIDRKEIVNKVYLGAAIPVFGPVTPGHGEWFMDDLPRIEHDNARAAQLLAAAGLIDRDKDGVLDDPSGKPARFAILTQKGHTTREQTMAVVQEQLRQVGLTVDIVALDFASLIDHYNNGDYDAMYFGPESNSLDPATNVDYWMSSGGFHMWNPNQEKPSTTWEAKIDELMRKQSMTVDPAERRKIFAECQRILAGEIPAIHLAAANVEVATSGRVGGAQASVIQPSVLWNAEGLWVRKR